MNYEIYYFFNSLIGVHGVLDFAILFIAEYLDMIVWVAALLFFIVHKDYPKKRRFISYQQSRTKVKEIILVSASVLSTWGIVLLLKKIFALPRPYLYLENVTLLFQYGNLDSFPSGHAAFFAALAVAVYFHHKKLSALLVVCALLIGVARIASGVHLPLDILAGYLFGGLFAWFIYKVYARIFRTLRRRANRDTV